MPGASVQAERRADGEDHLPLDALGARGSAVGIHEVDEREGDPPPDREAAEVDALADLKPEGAGEGVG